MGMLHDMDSMTDDEIYLEVYHQIYQLYCDKARIMYSDPFSLDNPKVWTQELFMKLGQINEEIGRTEKTFWGTIEKGKQVGKKYAVEGIADLHGLDIFEKRVMLFLIFARLSQPRQPGYCPEQIVQILGINNSVVERLNSLSYFSQQPSSFIKEVLLACPRGPVLEYQISPMIMQQISALVSGEMKDPVKMEAASG